MNVCKTCERTESEGQPFTKGLLDCHGGDCPSCDFERWLKEHRSKPASGKWKETTSKSTPNINITFIVGHAGSTKLGSFSQSGVVGLGLST
jgi:hypothetical protein